MRFDRPWLIACEGPGDKNVLDRLISHHVLDQRFVVQFPGKELGGSPGRGGIVPWLDLAYETDTEFRRNVKAVLIIADNDDVPEDSFKEILVGLKKAKALKTALPTKAQEVVRTAGMPDLSILMIPIGERGAIESLCVAAAYSSWPVQSAVDAYIAATPAKTWGPTKQAKARMQVVIGGTCEQRPETSLASMRDHCPFPVGDQSFSGIVEFLRGFEALLAAT